MLKATMRMIAALALLSLPFAAVSSVATAAEKKHEHKHEHDHANVAKHGGSVAEVGSYDVEIVVAGGTITVYVYDEHGDDISKDASKGDAIFVIGGSSKKVALTNEGGALVGKLGFETKGMDDLDAVLRLVIAGKTQTGKAEIEPK